MTNFSFTKLNKDFRSLLSDRYPEYVICDNNRHSEFIRKERINIAKQLKLMGYKKDYIAHVMNKRTDQITRYLEK